MADQPRRYHCVRFPAGAGRPEARRRRLCAKLRS